MTTVYKKFEIEIESTSLTNMNGRRFFRCIIGDDEFNGFYKSEDDCLSAIKKEIDENYI